MSAIANEGQTVYLTVTPATGYELDTLTVKQGDTDVTVTNNQFTMPAGDVNVSATFKKSTYTVTVAASENGGVTADKPTATMGETVSLTVTPAAGYELDTLTVKQGETDVSVTDNKFTMPAGNVNVSATFKKSTYTVTVAASENGGVTADKPTATMGETVSLTVTPAAGYELDTLTVKQGETDVSVTDNKFTMPAGNVNVSATFKKSTYTVTVAQSENGGVTADKPTATMGETVSLTVTPATGYELDTLTVKQGETDVTVTDNKFTMPAGNVSVSATFKKTSYTVTVAASENGGVTADKPTATMGETVSLTVTPAAGYELDTLTVKQGDTDVTVTNNQFTMPAGDVSVSAAFKKSIYTVTVAASENGGVTADKPTATMGETVSLTVTPATGYELDTLTVKQGETDVTVTDNKFTMPAGNVSVSATFLTSWQMLQKQINNGGTVTLTKNYTATADSNDLVVSENVTVTIDLNGFTVDRNEGGRVIHADGNLTVKDGSTAKTGKITGGKTFDNGAGVRVSQIGKLTLESGTISGNEAGSGGGVYIQGGSFIMKGGTISDNTASGYGGGVYISGGSGAIAVIEGGTISGNTASDYYGGGLCISSTGILTIKDTTISNNTAKQGGGVFNNGTLTMDGGTINNNISHIGGGVRIWGGSFTMNGGTISENESPDQNNFNGHGGGVFVGNDGSFTLSGGTINDNTAETCGGGVDVGDDSSFSLESGLITGNRSRMGGGVSCYGTVKMSGGTISDNTAEECGGGIDIRTNSAVFDMTGGMIMENSAALGSGVYAYSSTIKLSGNPTIKDNKTTGGEASNVYLLDTIITVTGQLINSAPISLMMFTPGVFTSGLENNGDASIFTSESTDYVVNLNTNGEAQLERLYSVANYTSENGGVTADKATATMGETVSLTVTPATGYELDTLTVKQGETDVTVTNNQFTMPAGNVNVSATFKRSAYDVYYDFNGGRGTVDYQTKLLGRTLTLTDAVPTREGRIFVGWAESADAASASYLPGGNFTKDADTTLYAVWKQPDFVLPASLTEIGEEAFEGGAFTFVKLPENAVAIGPRAFENCAELAYIYIPAAATDVDSTAFAGVTGLTIIGTPGTTAETYAQAHSFGFVPAA